ncbi:MAG: SAM-dependent methyltransferase [Cystobacter sp.]
MRSLLTAACLTLVGCTHTPAAPGASASADVVYPSGAIVSSPDRLESDRVLDAGRHPAALLDFVRASPGMKVAELMAGGGYTTELLARAVGPQGVVYGENPASLLTAFAEGPWSERLARPVNRNVVRLDRELDDPFPPELTGLDVVVSHIIYHDVTLLGSDPARMNAAVFRALKPGGTYVILDSSAKPGRGVSDAKTLHRIDEQTVRDEVTAAGFEFVRASDIWRNPNDTRDWNSSPVASGVLRGTSDRFALKFRKPR